MAYPFQLVVADPKKLRKIAKHARKLVDSRNGDPVMAISSMRIVLTPAAVGEIVDQAPTEDVTGRRLSFDELMARMGAESTSPLGPVRLSELLAVREPAELGALPRQELDESDLIRDGWDWHLKETRLVEAWDVFGGPENIDWKDIRVGQMDTGFRRIPALGFENADSPRSGFVLTDFDRNFLPSDFQYDPLQGVGNPFANEFSAEDPMLGGPFDGHGTRTGSVLAGYDPAAKPPYYGAAPRVPYIPVRISDTVIINHAQEGLARAIEHLVRNGCSVLTLSMGMVLTLIDERVRKAIDYAYEQGVILVCAAGNTWDPVVAPARLHRTIAVGGSTPAHTPWNGSSFGTEVDISAPAWPVRRASVDRKGRPTYAHGDGTSFATPAVAATAALWLLHWGRKIDTTYPLKWQRVEAFKRLLTSTAQPGESWNTRQYGAGILDAKAVLQADLPAANTLLEDRSA